VSDLHCPATLLLAPYDEAAERTAEAARRLAERLADENVSRVYGGTGAGVVQTAAAVGVAAAAEQRHELDADDVVEELNAIADLHRGETVLVVLPGSTVESALDGLVGRRARLRSGLPMDYGSIVEVVADGDGWALRKRVTPTDSVLHAAVDSEIRDGQPN
jgi:broad specificity phosphatase PhoE